MDIFQRPGSARDGVNILTMIQKIANNHVLRTAGCTPEELVNTIDAMLLENGYPHLKLIEWEQIADDPVRYANLLTEQIREDTSIPQEEKNKLLELVGSIKSSLGTSIKKGAFVTMSLGIIGAIMGSVLGKNIASSVNVGGASAMIGMIYYHLMRGFDASYLRDIAIQNAGGDRYENLVFGKEKNALGSIGDFFSKRKLATAIRLVVIILGSIVTSPMTTTVVFKEDTKGAVAKAIEEELKNTMQEKNDKLSYYEGQLAESQQIRNDANQAVKDAFHYGVEKEGQKTKFMKNERDRIAKQLEEKDIYAQKQINTIKTEYQDKIDKIPEKYNGIFEQFEILKKEISKEGNEGKRNVFRASMLLIFAIECAALIMAMGYGKGDPLWKQIARALGRNSTKIENEILSFANQTLIETTEKYEKLALSQSSLDQIQEDIDNRKKVAEANARLQAQKQLSAVETEENDIIKNTEMYLEINRLAQIADKERLTLATQALQQKIQESNDPTKTAQDIIDELISYNPTKILNDIYKGSKS